VFLLDVTALNFNVSEKNTQHNKVFVIDKKVIDQQALLCQQLTPVKLGQSLNLNLNLNLKTEQQVRMGES